MVFQSYTPEKTIVIHTQNGDVNETLQNVEKKIKENLPENI